MGFSVPNGYIQTNLFVDNVVDFYLLARDFETVLNDRFYKLAHTDFINRAVDIYDRVSFDLIVDEEIKVNPFHTAKRESKKCLEEEPTLSYGFEVCFSATQDSNIIMRFFGNGYDDIIKDFGFADYHYTSSHDKPDNLKDWEWEKRRRDWNSVVDSNGRIFGFRVKNDEMIPRLYDHDEFISKLDDDIRANNIAQTISFNDYVDGGTFESSRDALCSFNSWRRHIKKGDGLEEFEKLVNYIKERLPKITEEGLHSSIKNIEIISDLVT